MSAESLDVREHEPLAHRTTLGVGGIARWFTEVGSPVGITSAIHWARDRGVPLFVLGGGSNLLVADRGIEALVMLLSLSGTTEVAGDDGTTLVTVGAGERWDDFVQRAVARGFSGLECLSGIPGSVGATPIQNVGAYGQEVSDTIATVEAIDRVTAEPARMESSSCEFGYRDSVFKGRLRDRHVITSVTFRLARGAAAPSQYPELARALGDGPAEVGRVRDTVLALRRKKSMVLDPADPNSKSAGSFFTNPIVDSNEVEEVRAAAMRAGVADAGTMPAWDAGTSRTKLSAAWLIERAGFGRGTSRGAVGISTAHSLAIVNRGGARAAEIVAFAMEVQRGVHARFGVRLHAEPEMVGFTEEEVGSLRSVRNPVGNAGGSG